MTALPHHPGLQDAGILNTPSLRLARIAVRHAAETAGIGVVHGDAGLGKTFAVTYACGETGVPVVWAQVGPRPTLKEVTEQVLSAVLGRRVQGTRYELTSQLRSVLAEERRLVVLDEAQNLNLEAVEQIRHVHDDLSTDFALLLVGGHGCWKTIEQYPMLRSRVQRRVRFEPLTGEEVLKYMPRYHRLYEGADPALLLGVDRRFARGNLRRWAVFTEACARLIADGQIERLDEEAVDLCLVLINGVPDAA